MKKFNRFFSVLLTAALLTGMLVSTAFPVSAGTQEWTQIDTPDETDQVNPNIGYTDLLTEGADGVLYASAYDSDDSDYYLIRSDDGGLTWEWFKTPAFTGLTVGPIDAGAWWITAIAASPTEANVVYIASLHTVFKSTDGGETFAKMASVDSTYDISSMAVAKAGGTYKVFVGADTGAWDSAEVFYMDESDFFFAFDTIGTPSFNTQHYDTDVILDIALSPDFATDKGIVVLARDFDDDNDAFVSFNVNGGAWGATVAAAAIAVGYDVDSGVIALPADFNILTSPFFYVGLNADDIEAAGVFRVFGGAVTTTAAQLPYFAANEVDVFSMDVFGSFASCSIVIGTDGWDGNQVFTSVNSGATWTEGANLTGDDEGVFVAFDPGFATNGKIYAMTVADGTEDESAFQVSMDQGANFAQISLVNTGWNDIDEAAFAANGDIFIIVTNDSAGYDSLWRYTSANGWERVYYDADGTGAISMLKLSPNYATDGTVFVVIDDIIQKSVNKGKTWESQIASPGNIEDYVVIDMNTFVVATGSDIVRSTTGGFLWDVESTVAAVLLARSSDGTALAAYDGSKVYRSADTGATWDTGSVAQSNIQGMTFQYGSNAVIWATTSDGTIVSNASKSATSWTNRPEATGFADGVSIVSGMPGDFAIYALDEDGVVSRQLQYATGAEDLNLDEDDAPYFEDGAQIFIVPGNGANQLFVNADDDGLWTYTDTLAVPVTGIAASGIATSQTVFLGFVTGTSKATISWTEVANATDYYYEVGTTDPGKDYFSASGTSTDETSASLTGLDPDTVYYVSVWVEAPVTSFVGTFTFATLPTAPVIEGPGPSSTNIPRNPTFQWSSVSGATSYVVELSTSPTFATKTVLNSVIPVVVWDTNAPLAYGTDYYWSVQAVTANGTSAKTYGVFTTELAPEPQVTLTSTTPASTSIVLTVPTTETPGYIWIIIGVGGLLTILVIVLIVRTRRVV